MIAKPQPVPVRSRNSRYRLASNLSPKLVEWLWRNRIARGELTLVDGDPAVNKSSFLIDVAARVSSGREMPDGGEIADPGGVPCFSARTASKKPSSSGSPLPGQI